MRSKKLKPLAKLHLRWYDSYTHVLLMATEDDAKEIAAMDPGYIFPPSHAKLKKVPLSQVPQEGKYFVYSVLTFHC